MDNDLTSASPSAVALASEPELTDVSQLVQMILGEAFSRNASDIHFEPYEDFYRIRLRCDGILYEYLKPNKHLSRKIATRIKVLAELDIAEQRKPQDGRAKLNLDSSDWIDLRVSTLPTLWGEKLVLRLLSSQPVALDTSSLGFTPAQAHIFESALSLAQGMILVTGPTGSGKTVTLYSGLQSINSSEVNISTAEDPIEINLAGVNQVQIHQQIGFGFMEALRAFLRQDPDIIMLGEIRDSDTANAAVKAAQTGHLVLSTLHTNSASEALQRLNNMEVASYNIASSISLIIAQRLVRRLCPHCRQIDQNPVYKQDINGSLSQPSIYRANPKGCQHCTQGYRGRIGLFELMNITPELSHSILTQSSARELENLAIKQGMQTLQRSGEFALFAGDTSVQELHRVLG